MKKRPKFRGFVEPHKKSVDQIEKEFIDSINKRVEDEAELRKELSDAVASLGFANVVENNGWQCERSCGNKIYLLIKNQLDSGRPLQIVLEERVQKLHEEIIDDEFDQYNDAFRDAVRLSYMRARSSTYRVLSEKLDAIKKARQGL